MTAPHSATVLRARGRLQACVLRSRCCGSLVCMHCVDAASCMRSTSAQTCALRPALHAASLR